MLQDKGKIVSDQSVLVKTFNEHYVNTAEESCGKKSTNISQEYGDVTEARFFLLVNWVGSDLISCICIYIFMYR